MISDLHIRRSVHGLAVQARVFEIEAGIYPGVVYYLSTWFPDPYRIRMLGFFTLGSSLGNMVGGPIAALLDLNGWLGLAGWQWVFIVAAFSHCCLRQSSSLCFPAFFRADRAIS